MTKYSAPSIEVVTFNPADAPRIGMQWWGQGPTGYLALGTWTPSTMPTEIASTTDMTSHGIDCASVSIYRCFGETEPSVNHYDNQLGAYILVLDDGKSC